MNRRSGAWLSLVLVGLVSAGMAVRPVAAQESAVAKAAPVRKALFWKATSGTNVTYLLGSIHLGSKSMYPLAKEVEDAFERSTALIVEVDINRVDAAGMQTMILASGVYTGDDTLWDHVNPETRQKLEAFCDKYGFPAVAMAKLKPWVAAMTVAILPMSKNGMELGLGIDKYFLDKAVQTKKRVVEAESAELQIKLLSGFSSEVQERYLASALEDDGQDKIKQIQDAWISGDAERIDRMQREKSSVPEEVTKALLQGRNPHMADVAEQFLKGKDTGFMVVGAAHMVGANGVVRIHQQRGYKVEQVPIAAR